MAALAGGKDAAISSPKDVATNPRGIPQAPFVDKVEDYVTSREDVEPTLRRFQEMISKYQFMEQNLQRRVAGLDEKLPDIQKTLDTVQFLQTRRPGGVKKAHADEDDDKDSLDSDEDEDEDETDEGEAIETTFELNDTLYAKATIPPTDEVHLWLGANVMLSYPIDEAQELLEQKLHAAQTSRRNCEEDLEFLREQITTMEVAIARVYNWDVVQKRKEKTAAEATKGSSSKGDADEPDG
ncbi:peptide chain release factor 1 [Sporothrix epigloea]|uniref:Peptide chain release factor 1 n=1 Tax=Sporothrix epigloea TaxID=1892477 RepID=A0ABP0DZY9_9PEZI